MFLAIGAGHPRDPHQDRRSPAQHAYHRYQTKKQRERRETMEIYAPLEHRPEGRRSSGSLEDRARLCLDPIGFREFQQELEKRSELRGIS